MTTIGIGILSIMAEILMLTISSVVEFVVNPLLTFFVEGFTTDALN
ncbi:MAG TPA: hypothetical protein VNT79_09735 [Phycisphaerae bacterium]|nr:hypothetical protein [Phycisphaerae bacterium]